MRTIEDILADMKDHGTSPETIDRDIEELERALHQWINTLIHGKITLQDARVNGGFSLKEVARKTGISVYRLKSYEKDNRRMPFTSCLMLCELYKISMNHLYIGKTPSVENKHRLNLSLAGR